MTVKEFVQKTGYKVLAGGDSLHRQISSAYISDLLSWVMAHGKEGTVWVTVQTHLNVIAVACLQDFACVIIPENISVPEDTLKKADEEGMPVLTCETTGYGICRQLFALDIPEV